LRFFFSKCSAKELKEFHHANIIIPTLHTNVPQILELGEEG
jgi:hypothetical protein